MQEPATRRCSKCGETKPTTEFNRGGNADGYHAWCRSCSRENSLRRYHKLRGIVLAHYGTACACCGATEQLTIDHVNGGGREHRQVLRGSADIFTWLIEHGFPEEFQTLCAPCNKSKREGPACRLDHS